MQFSVRLINNIYQYVILPKTWQFWIRIFLHSFVFGWQDHQRRFQNKSRDLDLLANLFRSGNVHGNCQVLPLRFGVLLRGIVDEAVKTVGSLRSRKCQPIRVYVYHSVHQARNDNMTSIWERDASRATWIITCQYCLPYDVWPIPEDYTSHDPYVQGFWKLQCVYAYRFCLFSCLNHVVTRDRHPRFMIFHLRTPWSSPPPPLPLWYARLASYLPGTMSTSALPPNQFHQHPQG